MPILPNLVPPSSITIQDVVNYTRAVAPETVPILPVAGYSYEPALTFANDVLQKIMAQGADWRWNVSYCPLFLTNCLQQDYVTSLRDLGWLMSAYAIDINNNTNANNEAPKPFYTMEVGREIGYTAYMGQPQIVTFIQNSQANFGTWQPNTVYPCGYGVPAAPATPIQQIVDPSGNILYLDSTQLNLSINSPGYTASNPPTLPTPNPYGTTGTTQPVLPPGSPAGQTILDGTVTWTVADPSGFAIRLNPLPGIGGLCWLMQVVYQRRAPKFTSLQNTISPIPDDFAFLFRAGFTAYALMAAGSPRADKAYQIWEEQIAQARFMSQREQTEYGFYPDTGMTGGSTTWDQFSVGPASPFQYGYGW